MTLRYHKDLLQGMGVFVIRRDFDTKLRKGFGDVYM